MLSSIDTVELKSSLRNIKEDINAIHDSLTFLLHDPNTQATKSRNNVIELQKRLSEIEHKLDSSKLVSGTINSELTNIKNEVNIIKSTLVDTVCPSLNNQGILDLSFMFHNINNNLVDTGKEVCNLSTKITSTGETNASLLNQIIFKLDEISTKITGEVIVANQVLINYPRNGTVSLGSGYTTFNFYTGTVTKHDGSTDTMSDSVQNYGETYIKSFIIYADRKTDISVTGKSSYTISIPAGTFRIPFGEISKVEIYTDDNTNVWVSGSLVFNGAPNISPSSVDTITLPNKIIKGSKTNISSTAAQVTTTSTLINKLVTVKVRSLGGGTYIGLGDDSDQPLRLVSVGDSHVVDYIDDLSKVYCVTDGTNAQIEWIGG
jgi:hypothetical protein